MNIIKDNKIIGEVNILTSFFERLTGRIITDENILILNCNMIHTFFVKKSFDGIFLDKEYKIVDIKENIELNKFLPKIKNATHTLETYSGFVKKHNLGVNDELRFK